jgi:hypothetical protein
VGLYRHGAMHPRPDRHLARPALAAAILVVVLAACGSAAGTASIPSPTGGGPITREESVARALAQDPRFADIGPLDPNLIGQSAWYEVSPATVGWRVTITKGWGDCQAGCINKHTWVYDVDGSGAVRLVEETGDPVEDGTGDGTGGSGGSDGVGGDPPVAIPADGGPWVAGRAQAGPTCPVQQNPPDEGCADRPVAGAGVIVRDAAGRQVSQATTNPDGTFLAAVPAGGAYLVEAQPVEGLLGTPAAVQIVVPGGAAAWAAADLAYDTGIR